MLIIRRINGQWTIKEEHRDPTGQLVWGEYRTEAPPSMEGTFVLHEAVRICLLNLYSGENMLAAISDEQVVAITPFFIALRVLVGNIFVGPYETVTMLAKAMARAICQELDIPQE